MSYDINLSMFCRNGGELPHQFVCASFALEEVQVSQYLIVKLHIEVDSKPCQMPHRFVIKQAYSLPIPWLKPLQLKVNFQIILKAFRHLIDLESNLHIFAT